MKRKNRGRCGPCTYWNDDGKERLKTYYWDNKECLGKGEYEDKVEEFKITNKGW